MRGVENFGHTEEEIAQIEMTDSEKVALWLAERRQEERNRVYEGGIKGYRLNHYRAIAEQTRGVQPGLWGLLAKSHIGKTTLLTSLCVDVLRSNKNVKVVFYSFDDDVDYIRHMMIAFMAQVTKKRVDCKTNFTGEEQRVDAAYNELINYAMEDRFVIKDYDSIDHFDKLTEDIKSMQSEDKKLCVFLDGQANLDCDIRDLRAQNVYKQIK